MSQQAGVLLGYGELRSDGGYQYKTVWIVFSPTEARVAATVPDVIVPRATGFWRVGKTIVCEFDGTERDSARDAVWQTPIEKAPLIREGPPCKSHKAGDTEESDNATNESTAAGAHVPLCGRETAKLLFVSPGYLAEQFNAWDSCDARGGHDITRDDVRPLDNGAPMTLAELFGERAEGAYSSAAKKGFAENSKDYNCPEPDPERYDLKSWNIGHVQGAWRPFAALNEFMGECAYAFPTDLELPKSVTGETPKGAQLRAVAGAIPLLSDFFLSPLGDYALVLVSPKNAEYHLYAFTAKNGVPGKRLAEIPWDNWNSHPIVIAQWSSGKYVAQWTDALQKIQEHPLPEPVVRSSTPYP